MADRTRMQAVAETRAFSAEIDAMLSAAERDLIINGIALDPDGGDLIPGAGGLRKRRIPLPGRGKRGGARVITLYLGDAHPGTSARTFRRRRGEFWRAWLRISNR